MFLLRKYSSSLMLCRFQLHFLPSLHAWKRGSSTGIHRRTGGSKVQLHEEADSMYGPWYFLSRYHGIERVPYICMAVLVFLPGYSNIIKIHYKGKIRGSAALPRVVQLKKKKWDRDWKQATEGSKALTLHFFRRCVRLLADPLCCTVAASLTWHWTLHLLSKCCLGLPGTSRKWRSSTGFVVLAAQVVLAKDGCFKKGGEESWSRWAVTVLPLCVPILKGLTATQAPPSDATTGPGNVFKSTPLLIVFLLT